jgi:hypothetical protein
VNPPSDADALKALRVVAAWLRFRDGSAVDTPDELVAFPFGFERRAASALVRAGALPTKKIGRRLYARRSDLLALVEDVAKVTRAVAPTASDSVAAARAAYALPSLRVLRGAR